MPCRGFEIHRVDRNWLCIAEDELAVCCNYQKQRQQYRPEYINMGQRIQRKPAEHLSGRMPSLYATKPCETSWKVIAIRIGKAEIRILLITSIVVASKSSISFSRTLPGKPSQQTQDVALAAMHSTALERRLFQYCFRGFNA
jgi:hypothetical protein